MKPCVVLCCVIFAAIIVSSKDPRHWSSDVHSLTLLGLISQDAVSDAHRLTVMGYMWNICCVWRDYLFAAMYVKCPFYSILHSVYELSSVHVKTSYMWRDGLAEKLSKLLARERTALAQWRRRTSQQQLMGWFNSLTASQLLQWLVRLAALVRTKLLYIELG